MSESSFSWKSLFQSGMIHASLTREKPIIAVYGSFQIGKSTLTNCLLGRYAALTGKGLSTTALTARYRFGAQESLKYRTHSGGLTSTSLSEINRPDFVNRVDTNGGFHIEARLNAPLLESLDLVDTPGINANESDTAAALSILDEVHYVIFVLSNRGLNMTEKAFLQKLFIRRIPVLFVMNCNEGRCEEKWLPRHPINQQILSEAESWLKSQSYPKEPINGRLVYPCNALFYWLLQADYEKSTPYIDRPDTLRRHIRYTFEDADIPDTDENLLAQSGIPELIDFLKQRVAQYDPFTHNWR